MCLILVLTLFRSFSIKKDKIHYLMLVLIISDILMPDSLDIVSAVLGEIGFRYRGHFLLLH